MPSQEEADRVIARIIKQMHDAGADRWSIQDKGALLAAVKLALVQRREDANA